MSHSEVKPNAHEYASANEAYRAYKGSDLFGRQSHGGYNPRWDEGSRIVVATPEDLRSLRCCSAGLDSWADDWEPYRAPTRRPVRSEWDSCAQVTTKFPEGLRIDTDEPSTKRPYHGPIAIRVKYGEGPAHGTNSRYEHKAYKCRCEECKEAHREYGREYRLRRKSA